MIGEAVVFGGAVAAFLIWLGTGWLAALQVDKMVKGNGTIPALIGLLGVALVAGVWIGLAWCILYALGARA